MAYRSVQKEQKRNKSSKKILNKVFGGSRGLFSKSPLGSRPYLKNLSASLRLNALASASNMGRVMV
jgi:hypothetical protein